jgi:hypothetical protein
MSALSWSIIYNSQDMETKCPSVDEWIKNEVYTYSGILSNYSNPKNLSFLTTW